MITGLPKGTKGRPVVGVRPEQYERQIHGQGERVWWSRGLPCPCRSATTEQPTVGCPLCKNTGWMAMLPQFPDRLTDDHGNRVEVSEDGTAVAVKMLVLHPPLQLEMHGETGQWPRGSVQVTAQAENTLGFMDRIELRDATLMLTQLIVCGGGPTLQHEPRRALQGFQLAPVKVHVLRTVDTVYRETEHFRLIDGVLTWLGTPPARGTVITVAYDAHPVYRLTDLPFAYRYAQADKGQYRAAMPHVATGMLDFLLGGAS